MHYFANGGPGITDQSGFRFETATEVDTEVTMYPYGPDHFTIPAGDAAFTEEFLFTSPDEIDLGGGVVVPMPDITLHGAIPHMHVLGTHFRMWAEYADGSDECLAESDFDFSNQITYMFDETVTITPGDAVGFACTWNNSPSNPNLIHNPPIDVSYGERTDEEMCWSFAYFSLEW